MKKVLGLFAFLLCFIVMPVYAESYNINYEEKDGKYVLYLMDGEEKLSYEEALEKYSLNPCFVMFMGEEEIYFYMGKQVSYDEYMKMQNETYINEQLEEYGEYAKRVHSVDDIMNALDKIYTEKKSGEYHLFYTEDEYRAMNMEEFKNRYIEKYIGDFNKNMYTYEEYGIIHPIKMVPTILEDEIVVNGNIFKTTDNENEAVEKFLDYLLPYFDEKSDYEKALGIYTYLNTTTSYEKDDGYINLLDGVLSPYDALIEKKVVCIGAATTFQFLAEKVGLTSYIVDHVADSRRDEAYVTTHTFNVLKIDGKWYIVDINNKEDLSGFLKGISDAYSTNDFEYKNIKIEDEDYFATHMNAKKDFSFDYEKLNKEIDKIKNKKQKEEKLESSEETKNKDDKDNFISVLVLFLILSIVSLIVYIFVRKK